MHAAYTATGRTCGGIAGKTDLGFYDALYGRVDGSGRPAADVESLHCFFDVVVNGIAGAPKDLANLGRGFPPGDPGQTFELTRRKQVCRSS